MVQLSRMDLADVGSPEALVATILKQVPEMPIPVPIEDVARSLDIEDIRYLETDGFEGSLICTPNKNRGVILVNDKGRRQRKRFTASHELGHFLIPTHRPINAERFVCSSRDMSCWSFEKGDRVTQMEAEANRFASNLLMPLPFFRRDMDKLHGCDISHILRLAVRYDTSKEATARRYVEAHDEPCTAIVSNNAVIRAIYRPHGFPFITPGIGSRVPEDSITARFSGAVGDLSDWNELDGSVWLSYEYGKRPPAIYEQTLIQSDGFRLTVVNIESSDEEEAEEEEGLERSWQPRFRR